MRRIFTAAVMLVMMIAETLAQRTMLTGTVVDAMTGSPIAQASVAVGRSGIAVVTNDDGFFSLKTDSMPEVVTVSHIGYLSQRLNGQQLKDGHIDIRLKPTMIQLQEIIIWTENPRELVNIAMRKIPENYSRNPELYRCFYRETAMKRQHYIYVAEGVVDMYKTAYNRDNGRDRVAIRKGRRLLSPKLSDTLTVKVLGGPTQPIMIDIAKNRDFLLNPEDLACYDFAMEMPEVIDGRTQFVVSLSPKVTKPYALYYGKLYIDRETLAFTRAELSLDMSNSEKATRYMLVSKPMGVRFKPKELSCLIDYRYDEGVTRISYVRSTFRFNCDWKRRLLATSFTAFCEMAVTDRSQADARPISGRDSFDSRDAFFDKVDYFRDPDFWEDYNIIEPTESLDKAIGKLLKKYR